MHSSPAGYQQQQQQQGGYPAHSAQTNPDVPAALSPRNSLAQSHTGTTPQRGSTLANLKTAAIGIHVSLFFFFFFSSSLHATPFLLSHQLC
jgi:hypothetical protein